MHASDFNPCFRGLSHTYSTRRSGQQLKVKRALIDHHEDDFAKSNTTHSNNASGSHTLPTQPRIIRSSISSSAHDADAPPHLLCQGNRPPSRHRCAACRHVLESAPPTGGSCHRLPVGALRTPADTSAAGLVTLSSCLQDPRHGQHSALHNGAALHHS